MYQISDNWVKELTMPNIQLIPVKMNSFKKSKVLFFSQEPFMFGFLFVSFKFLKREINGLLAFLLLSDERDWEVELSFEQSFRRYLLLNESTLRMDLIETARKYAFKIKIKEIGIMK